MPPPPPPLHPHRCSEACRSRTQLHTQKPNPKPLTHTHTQSPFAPAGSAATPVTLPVPLLFALTDPKVAADSNNRLMHQRAFSFFSTEDSAEVQLGGYDPARSAPHPLALSRLANTFAVLPLPCLCALPCPWRRTRHANFLTHRISAFSATCSSRHPSPLATTLLLPSASSAFHAPLL